MSSDKLEEMKELILSLTLKNETLNEELTILKNIHDETVNNGIAGFNSLLDANNGLIEHTEWQKEYYESVIQDGTKQIQKHKKTITNLKKEAREWKMRSSCYEDVATDYSIELSLAPMYDLVATKIETAQFDCFQVSFEDSKRLKELPVGAKIYVLKNDASDK